MPDPQNWHLLDRYLAGEASPDEITEVHTRTQTDPDWAHALDALRTNFTKAPAERDTNLAWSRLQSRLSPTHDVTPLPATRPTSSVARATRPWLRIAATVLVAAGSLAAWQILSARRAGQ